MKYIKFINEKNNNVSFIEPELDYSEFFRLFNVKNEYLPKNIDKNLFDESKYYVDIVGEKNKLYFTT